MKLQLLNVVSDFLPFGLGEQAALMAPWLADQFDVRFFSIGQAGLRHVASLLGDLPHMAIRCRPRNWPVAAWQLRRLLRRDEYGIVHAWGGVATDLARWSLSGRGHRRGHTVFVSRVDVSRDRSASIRRIVDAVTCNPDVELTADAPCRQAAGDPLLLQPIASVHQRSQAPSTNLRTELGLESSIELIGTVAELEAKTGLKHLIWAADLVNCVRDDVRLVIWGNGSQRDNLRRFAGQIGDAKKYIWLPRDQNIRQQLDSLDVFWEPTRLARLACTRH